MQFGLMQVGLAEAEVKCDSCAREALLLIDGQPQCAQDGGTRLASDPEVIANIVAILIKIGKPSSTPK